MNYETAYYEAMRAEAVKERDVARRERNSASDWNGYLGGACVALLLTLLYVCMQRNPLPLAKPCPSPGVMQLDPTTIWAQATEVVEL